MVNFKKLFRYLYLEGIISPYFRLLPIPSDTRVCKYEVSLCLVFYNEAKFLKEWLDYHLLIGVAHFYLYNNNSTDDYLEVLESYIKNGLVTLIDYSGSPAQPFVYQHCLENYKDETRWLGFIDADEFVCLLNKDNIIDWLSDYRNYPCVNVKWKVFGTGGIMEHDYSRLVIEQYFLCEKSSNHFTSVQRKFLND